MIQQAEKINAVRERKVPNRQFVGKSNNDVELKEDRFLKVSYIAVLLRMALFIEYSTRIYKGYIIIIKISLIPKIHTFIT